MSSSMSEFQHLEIPLESIKQATNNFGDGNFIAKGGFGEVYSGEFFHSKAPTVAAVKRLTPSNNQGDADFWREIMLLSDYKHENIILLLGFCYQSGERILVYEYAPNKSLDNHLRDPNFTWIQRLKICLGAARGLEYLHNPRGGQKRVLHRDIKSANILLDENWNAKIADFGFSKFGPANQKHSILFSEPKGTLGYCDPVFVETSCYRKESDVYSFGVVLLEVLCSRFCVDYNYKPNDIRRSLTVLVKKSSKEQLRDTIINVNLLQQMKRNSFDTFVTLVYHCLEREQKQRPPMDLVVKKLETALSYQEGRNVLSSNVNLAASSTRDTGKKKLDPLAQKGQARSKPVTHRSEEDDAIKRWSSGKRGDLRVLLSTLQHILGAESGWEPVSLTELMDNDVVRDTYNKALTHNPGSSTKEKYIFRKVLELLRVPLKKFDSEEKDLRGKCYDETRRWAGPREFNLHALLSTLQNILLPESGWEPVSEANLWADSGALKEAYTKSTLLTDPDQLKERGASMHERYLYEKVHEYIEAAWSFYLRTGGPDRYSETDQYLDPEPYSEGSDSQGSDSQD